MSLLIFKPVYGWGWFQGPNTKPVEVPTPFVAVAINVSETEVIGLIEAPHEFAGLNVRLSLRSEMGSQKHWNVCLFEPGQGQITGFAESV